MRDTLFARPSDDVRPVAPFRFDAEVARVFPDMLDRSIPGYASIIAQTGLIAARFARSDTRLYDLGCSLGASALAMRSALTVPPEDAVSGEAVDGGAAKPSDEESAREGIAGTPVAEEQGNGGDARETIVEGESDEAARARAAIARSIVIEGVDNSPAMLERAAAVVAEAERATPADAISPHVQLREADLAAHPLEPCSVVAMNFTLQFVAPDERAALLERIVRALVPGGALILSEKLRFADPAVDALHVDMYHAFKRANGYSALEVARKRAALEDVLVPNTLAEHEARLAAAGFARTSVWFQCFNFVSLVAIR